jgi:tetratricopeptide (TPR) repeat protein
MKPSATIHKIAFWIITATVFLTPLFFLPVTSDFYEFNKQILLFIVSSVLFILLSVSFILDRQVRLVKSPLGLPLLAILAVWLGSTFFKSPNYFDAFFESGQTGTYVALILFFFSAINLLRTKKETDTVLYAYLSSLGLLAVVTILWASGLASGIINISWLKLPVWSPTGNPLASIILLATSIPFAITTLVREKGNSPKSLILSVLLFLSVIAGGLMGYRLFRPGSEYQPLFLSQQDSWAIALESLKVSPLTGSGPATYLSDFSGYRPLTYNLGTNWAVRFSSASNYYLHLLTITGILGLVAYLFLVTRTVSLLRHVTHSSSESPFHALALSSIISALFLFILQLFIPPVMVVIFATFFLLTLAIASLRQLGSPLVTEANIDIVAATESGARTPILPWVSLFFSLVIAIPVFFFTYQAFAAETFFQKALTAAAANQGKTTYDNLIEAIRLNPYKDTYRVAYSQTNLLLANSIAGNANLTQDDRSTVAQLVQQSIREGKNAVSLNPTKVTNLENLAGIYRNLLGFADGADAWAIAAYQEAINVDPVNPNLRIALGGVQYALKNYDEAIKDFQAAADLKPNLANAYYNLAAAYREKGDLQNAVTAMQQVVTLVDPSSSDYTQAQSELTDLKKKLGTTAPAAVTPAPQQSELQAPKPLPTAAVKPPLELPSDLGPNVSTTPAPTPTISSPTVPPTPKP